MRQNLINKMLREEAILLSLKTLDYMSRSQIQRLHNLSGDRNARRVLGNLSEFVSSFRGDNGELVYYLNKLGRERTGSEVIRKKMNQVGHYLMRADTYLFYRPEEWKNEQKITVPNVVTLISDAHFRHNQRRHFLEIDHLQHMTDNHKKIERYKKLYATGVFQQKIKYFPRLVWVTAIESRKKQLSEWCHGLDTVIHTWDEIRRN